MMLDAKAIIGLFAIALLAGCIKRPLRRRQPVAEVGWSVLIHRSFRGYRAIHLQSPLIRRVSDSRHSDVRDVRFNSRSSTIRPTHSNVSFWPHHVSCDPPRSARNGLSNFLQRPVDLLVRLQLPLLRDERIPQGINFSHTRIVVAGPYSCLYEYKLGVRIDDDPLTVHTL